MVELRVEKVADRLGYARIIVAPLPLPAITPSIVIRREGFQEANLGYRGWQVREEQLMPTEVTALGDATALMVGPQVTRHLEPAPYVFEIPCLNIRNYLFWPDDIDDFDGDLPPERHHEREADDNAAHQMKAAVQEAEANEKEPKKEKIGQTPGPDAQRVKPNRQPLYVGGGLLALLLIAAAAAWFAFPEFRPGMKTTQAAEPGSVPSAPTLPPPSSISPPPTHREPAAPEWPEGTDELSLVEVDERSPNAEAVYVVAKRRMQAGKYEDALVLYEQAAKRGSVPALTALARLYDPNTFEPGKPFRNPDGRTAARYYKDAVAGGDVGASVPREALRLRLEGEARDGNGTAATALKDYWP
jgi:hypothetical protein